MQNSKSNNIGFKVHYCGNIIGVWIISIILLVAFYYQFFQGDLPCPLCLLQRVCFVAVGIALSMNIRFSAKPAHYGMAILASLLGVGIALRQVLLHIHPNDPGYGSPLWGVHFYSWASLCFFIIVLVIGVGLHFSFTQDTNEKKQPAIKSSKIIENITLWVFAILILANLVSTFTECGLGQCPDNPTTYWLLSR